MTSARINPLEQFHWTPQPQAERLIGDAVEEILRRNTFAARLAQRMKDQTGTRFIDWIDHLVLPASEDYRVNLSAAGFTLKSDPAGAAYWVHEGGIFPVVRLSEAGGREVAIKVESIADFAAAHDFPLDCPDPPLTLCRRLHVASEGDAELLAVERHGVRGFTPLPQTDRHRMDMLRHAEIFRTRRRAFPDDEQAFQHTNDLLDRAIADVGVSIACDLFFTAEREYWQRRNRAAQVQKARQDRLGLGWANHDHHTYRSSRQHFAGLIGLFEKLGFYCRERFCAGAEAGWGAQVLEQPEAGIVIFADVDLSPEELFNDFAHAPLPERHELGTVGLWCALHGEAIFQAGMHHLECQFDFESLRQQLEEHAAVRTMKLFTDLPYLRQAFTEGERWPVAEARIARLLSNGQITPAQAEQFRRHGAIGSHLENLQRDQGFKGFNQTGVSEIIRQTDPRKRTVGES